MKAFVLMASLLALAACESDDGGGSSGVNGPFLVMSELQPGNKFNDLAASRLNSELKNESFVYLHKPKDDKTKKLADEADEQDRCFDDLFNSTVAEGDASTVKFMARIDASKCLKDDTQGLNVSMVLAFYAEFTCSNVDLTPFLGKTFKEVAEQETPIEEIECATSSVLLNLQAATTFSGRFEGKNETVDVDFQGLTYGYVGDASGNPCVKTRENGELKIQDGCLSIDRSVQVVDKVDGKASKDEGKEDYSRFETVGISGETAGKKPYFKDGTIKVQLNGWTGELTYSDSDTAPAYDLTKDGVTESGVVGVTGKGWLEFGNEYQMAYGSCGAFALKYQNHGGILMPSPADHEITLTSSSATFYSDAACSQAVTKVTLAKGQSKLPIYVKADASVSTFYISASWSDGKDSLYVEVTGIDSAALEFVSPGEVKRDACVEIKIRHEDGTPAKVDVPIALAATGATLHSDAACAAEVDEVTFAKGSASVSFYLMPTGESSYISLQGTPPDVAGYLSSVSLSIDRQKLTFGAAPTVGTGGCGKVSVIHGFDSGPADAPGDVAFSISVTGGGTAYADAACTNEITSATIAKGAAGVDFYVKPSGGSGTSLTVWVDPEDDEISFTTLAIEVQ